MTTVDEDRFGEDDHAAGDATDAAAGVDQDGGVRALGVTIDFFDDHIAVEVGCAHRGRRQLYTFKELERWLG